MALRAGHGYVRSRQRVARLLVLGDGECRAMKIFYCVAILAAILVGRGGELLVMLILMAIQAGRELHLVLGIFACRSVALVASHSRVLSFQRVFGSGVFLHAEQ